MAKKKIELFVEVQNEKEFDQILRSNSDRLICAEVYSEAFGPCVVLDRLFTKIKLDWSDGTIILLKVPADEIEALSRFRNQSQPVYLFIVAWLNRRVLEKEEEEKAVLARRAARQAERKRHRAELLAPHLWDLNFVLFWPHCFHAHPELYERWDANNIIMVGREELQLTEEMVPHVLYAGDSPLNEASLNKLLSGPSLVICFRLLDKDKHFVSLVRKILYEEIPTYDDSKSVQDQLPPKTAFDRYKTYSPTREQIWQLRREERERKKEELKEKRVRRLSEMQRLARQAILEAIEAKQAAREQLKLKLLKTGNLAALEDLAAQAEVDEVDIVVPEELSDVEGEETAESEDNDEYFPPPGLLIPGFYAPPNDVAKANGLAILFPKLVLERVTPSPEYLPPHILVMLEITKRFKAIQAIAPHKAAIIHMGIFQALSPYDSVHIAYSVRQYESLDISSRNLEEIKLAFMLSIEGDLPVLALMDLNPVHVSRDATTGEDECAAMFPVNYGDNIDQFEDFY